MTHVVEGIKLEQHFRGKVVGLAIEERGRRRIDRLLEYSTTA